MSHIIVLIFIVKIVIIINDEVSRSFVSFIAGDSFILNGKQRLMFLRISYLVS